MKSNKHQWASTPQSPCCSPAYGSSSRGGQGRLASIFDSHLHPKHMLPQNSHCDHRAKRVLLILNCWHVSTPTLAVMFSPSNTTAQPPAPYKMQYVVAHLVLGYVRLARISGAVGGRFFSCLRPARTVFTLWGRADNLRHWLLGKVFLLSLHLCYC